MRFPMIALALMLGIGLLMAPASAQTTNAQQDRMKTCNAEAGAKKLTGGARKTFMSDCLSGKASKPKPLTAQQQKMKDCNASAASQKLSGDVRKTFMSSCLKKN